MNAIVKVEDKELTFMDVDPASHIGNCLLNVCLYELPNLEIIKSLNVGGNYVDAGAHIGTHSLYFSLFCQAKRIYAFEPHPPFFSALLKNLDANGVMNVRAFKVGLVDKDGETMPDNEGFKLETATLDSFKLEDVRLLKIDVEGMELQVLKGAKRTLKTVEHVFLEVWPEKTCIERGFEYPMQAITDFLAPYGLKYKRAMPWEDLHFWSKD